MHHPVVRELEELVSGDDDAWSQVLAWRAAASRRVEIVPATPEDGRATLLALQITTRSPMGALALRCGGLLIDHGWLRILGARNPRIGDGLREWNGSLGGLPLDPPLDDALVVAYDAVGGFFALNRGNWDAAPGTLHYLGPGDYAWQGFELGYSEFMQWAMSDDLEAFYQGSRWAGWQAEVERLGPDQAMSIYPPLGFEASADGYRKRSSVPARELWTFHHSLSRQLGEHPAGSDFRIELK